MPLQHQWRFLRGYLRDPQRVGAVAPSSPTLASALCEPYRCSARPVSVLEVGAGTGAVTRHLGTLLHDSDRLDVCEIRHDFADVLKHEVLGNPDFAGAVASGRVRLLRLPIQQLPGSSLYDFVISGLPLTAFGIRDVREVLGVIRRCLKPGGVFSYFEYVGMRRAFRTLALGKGRRRIRLVSAYLSRKIAAHEFSRRTVLRNFPPAYARHWRFDGS